MDLMSIAQLLGNFGEFVGAIAVVVTLVYLAVQVKQSKVATEVRLLSDDGGRRQASLIPKAIAQRFLDQWPKFRRIEAPNALGSVTANAS